MRLEGSCHCSAVRFTVEAYAPHPFMRCYCSVCRKTQGGGGYAVNLGASFDSLEIAGDDAIAVYHAVIDGEESPAERRFCSRCGSALWLWDPRWPELVHPFASAIDTELPRPPETLHIMLDFAKDWARPDSAPEACRFARYPDLSLEEWHEQHGLLDGRTTGKGDH